MMNVSNPSSRRLRSNLLVGATIFLLAIFFLHHYAVPSLPAHFTRTGKFRRPTNATLGFGGIYVVSGRNSPRQPHLLEAAAVTELEFTIPLQNEWTEEDIRNFRIPDEEKSKVGRGSILAWLSHHLVLRSFLDSGKETVLILEDDVDWDIRLRREQIPILQAAARSIFNSSFDPDQHPWGLPEDWDLLYLGHCGDYFGNLGDGVGVGHQYPEDLMKIPHALAADPSMLERADLHPFTSSLLTAFKVPEQTRIFHKSQWPLCTFGYAVNRRSAQRLMDEIAPAKESAEHPVTAYDAAILEGCRDGPLKCYTVQPELFHHMEGDSLIAGAEKDTKHFRPPVDAAGLDQVKHRGETSNIGCGFWSGDFYADGDSEKLRYLISEVGRKGQCLKEKAKLVHIK